MRYKESFLGSDPNLPDSTNFVHNPSIRAKAGMSDAKLEPESRRRSRSSPPVTERNPWVEGNRSADIADEQNVSLFVQNIHQSILTTNFPITNISDEENVSLFVQNIPSDFPITNSAVDLRTAAQRFDLLCQGRPLYMGGEQRGYTTGSPPAGSSFAAIGTKQRTPRQGAPIKAEISFSSVKTLHAVRHTDGTWFLIIAFPINRVTRQPQRETTFLLWSQVARVHAGDLGPDHLGGMFQGLFVMLDLNEEAVELDLSEGQQGLVDQAILLPHETQDQGG
ncbi:hypothetical protein DL768_001504 [Monosporascus sp. mg162]|nr:hypothetical protein DL768_001504 [Monosporascus sp. mg162]